VITKKIWIPDDAVDFQLRICVVGHQGAGGHRGFDATYAMIEEFFYWTTMKGDVKEFHSQCIHCLASGGPHKIPRPMGEALHADKPNDLLHMDFLYLGANPKIEKPVEGKGKGKKRKRPIANTEEPRPIGAGLRYCNVLKDDASSFIQLDAAIEPTADVTCDSLQSWGSRFGIPQTWVSDRGTHFKNSVIEEMRRRYGAIHHFVLAHCPWANGTVETFMSQILRVLRALLSEFRMEDYQWPKLLPLVMGILNSMPSAKLGGRSPMEVFTGIKPTRPLSSLRFPVEAKTVTFQEVPEKIREQFLLLEIARDALHKEVALTAAERRDRVRERYNGKTGVVFPNFSEGIFVLVAREAQLANQKLRVRWQGPRRIVACKTPWVYEVEDLVHGRRREVHVTRMKFYQDEFLEVTEEIRHQAAHMEKSYEVEAFHGLRFEPVFKRWELLVQWRGFEDAENSWEPVDVVQEDVNTLIRHYLTKGLGKTLRGAATVLASLPDERKKKN
jgi:transposase InsO family protein